MCNVDSNSFHSHFKRKLQDKYRNKTILSHILKNLGRVTQIRQGLGTDRLKIVLHASKRFSTAVRTNLYGSPIFISTRSVAIRLQRRTLLPHFGFDEISNDFEWTNSAQMIDISRCEATPAEGRGQIFRIRFRWITDSVYNHSILILSSV